MNGNLTGDAKHIGYKSSLKGKSFCEMKDRQLDMNTNAQWLQEMETLLTEVFICAQGN